MKTKRVQFIKNLQINDMIKKSTYIRSFTPLQNKQLEIVGTEQKIKTVPEILFFTLENYLDQKKEIERLNRIIQYKQNKIEKIESKLDFFKAASDKIHELSEILKF
jgi:hypothetical protein